MNKSKNIDLSKNINLPNKEKSFDSNNLEKNEIYHNKTEKERINSKLDECDELLNFGEICLMETNKILDETNKKTIENTEKLEKIKETTKDIHDSGHRGAISLLNIKMRRKWFGLFNFDMSDPFRTKSNK